MIDKAERKSKVDPTTGGISYVYSYGNRPCAVEEVESILAEKYVAYDLINHDLQCANEWIEQAYLFLPARNKIMMVMINIYQ